jgi:hypothetical protein
MARAGAQVAASAQLEMGKAPPNGPGIDKDRPDSAHLELEEVLRALLAAGEEETWLRKRSASMNFIK